MENRNEAEEGICILSFDGGGPGSMSQLRILEEFMARLACERNVEVDEIYPADYFDLMGGVGFGGLVVLLLGRLRMTVSQAMEELNKIGTTTFPEGDDLVTPDVNMSRLHKALEDMLERNGHSVETKLRGDSDSRCKVVVFAATTAVMDHCHPFRTYRSPRKCLECILVDAACATLAISDYFPPVTVGPRRQSFAGIPHNVNNPMREVLKEAKLIFGEKTPVSLVLSLGAGQRARHSSQAHDVTRRSRIHCDGVARDLEDQLKGVGEYLRLNVDRGMENIQPDDWRDLGSIETYTDVYLEMKRITEYIDRAAQWLLQRNGSISLGQLCGTGTESRVTLDSENLKNYLAMEFKQMHEIVQQGSIAKITLIDAIGNDIPIPLGFCVTYSMLLDVISVYFRHQKPPGREFVERGDYRLLHGNRRNIIGAIEWTEIEKAGLKVEMSVVLRTRNEDEERCPTCSTIFEGRSMDGWAQCLSCSGHFQIETQEQSDDMTQPEDSGMIERGIVTPEAREPGNRELLVGNPTDHGEPVKPQFRLISVVNLLEIEAPGAPAQLYVGSLHFQLTEDDIKQVFEPFGEIEFVDLQRDRPTGRSKGYCFIQYRRPEDARMALEQMDGFELAGRTLRVNTVQETGMAIASDGSMGIRGSGNQAESLDEAGGDLNAVSRRVLMQKLARIPDTQIFPPVSAPKIGIKSQETRCVLLTNAFDPAEETEPDWDKDLLDDVKAECETRFGKVERIVVEKYSRGEIYMQFGDRKAARNALANLDGRWFGGHQISASYISDAIMRAHA